MQIIYISQAQEDPAAAPLPPTLSLVDSAFDQVVVTSTVIFHTTDAAVTQSSITTESVDIFAPTIPESVVLVVLDITTTKNIATDTVPRLLLQLHP